MAITLTDDKTHYATKADTIRWIVGVGVATVIAIAGIVLSLFAMLQQSMDTRITHLDTRLTQEIQEVRKETRENSIALAVLSSKVAVISDKLAGLSDKMDTLIGEVTKSKK